MLFQSINKPKLKQIHIQDINRPEFKQILPRIFLTDSKSRKLHPIINKLDKEFTLTKKTPNDKTLVEEL